ncbi:hypothetical protein DRF59_17635 [Chryseobacterium flavum]|uniref:Uncharacterized protein n=1 Tax=Chryseobacterium flavum TaxID=415851 RepID=A0A3D9CHF3_9FLAO|nr:hypothetical protein DRF59_17635 [Chryseobacterium flavum]
MIKRLSVIWLFYRKIIPATVLFSLLCSFLLQFNPDSFGLSFLFILPVLHYFIYELRLKNEYYFYANFGISRLLLWIITVSSGLSIKIITWFL